jgi:predicted CXXCH cytochrome family protein
MTGLSRRQSLNDYGEVMRVSTIAITMRVVLVAAALGAPICVVAQGKRPAVAAHGTVSSAALPQAQAAAPKCESCHAAIANSKETDTRHPAMEMGCDSCHVPHAMPRPAKGDTPKSLKKTVPELCADCHDLKERSAMKYQHAVANDCTTCHNPHSSPNAKLLAEKQPALCETCHSSQAEAHQKDKFLHKPAFDTGCSTCHDPHASANEHQLRAQGNTLCLTCHAQNAPGAAASGEKTLSLFDGKVQLPADYLVSVRRIAVTVNQTKGHPTANHPVSGGRDVALTKKPIECITCHNPHSSTGSPQLFVTGKKSPSQLCIRCH